MGIVARGPQKHLGFTKNINTLLLISHIGLLCLFLHLHVTFMVYVNIGSIALYFSMFRMYKKNIVKYVFISYLEVLVHMVLATVCVGWNGGFHLYAFCLIPCAFLCDYLSKTDGGKSMYPKAISVIIVLGFLAARGHCVWNEPFYPVASVVKMQLLFSYNAVVTFCFLMIYMSVFSERILEKEKQLEVMAELDELTKLPNRYIMHEWLSGDFLGADDEKRIAVAIMDIDDFKLLNDTYGHECGDLVLREIADEISAISSKNLKVCRWGGEEFVFMGMGENAYEQMNEKLETLRKEIEKKTVMFQNKEIKTTVTIGIAEYLPADASFQETLKRADERLYQGKEKGKNRIVGKDKIK